MNGTMAVLVVKKNVLLLDWSTIERNPGNNGSWWVLLQYPIKFYIFSL